MDSPAAKIVGTVIDVPIDKVTANEWNYNEVSPFTFKKLVKSIVRFGFVEPIIAYKPKKSKKYVIINGEHRWLAAKEVGLPEVQIKVLGIDSEHEAMLMGIALNEIHGKPNNDQLYSLLQTLQAGGMDLSVLPYEEEDVARYIKQISDDPSAYTPPGIGDDDADTEDDDATVGNPPAFDLAAFLGVKTLGADESQELVELISDIQKLVGRQQTPMAIVRRALQQFLKRQERKKA